MPLTYPKSFMPVAALLAAASAVVGFDGAVSLLRKRVMRVVGGGVPVRIVSVGQRGSEPVVSLGPSPLTSHPGPVVLWSTDRSCSVVLGPAIYNVEGFWTRPVLGQLPQAMIREGAGFLYGHLGQTPADFDLPFHEVVVGNNPAWVVPPQEGSLAVRAGVWVIHAHGLGGGRNQTLRGLPVFAKAGFTSLVPSFGISLDRGDDHDRYGSFGMDEVGVLAQAHRFAVAGGATSVLFVGWSYGALAVVRTLAQNPWEDVRGLVLVSPALDWKQIVKNAMLRASVPPGLVCLMLSRFNSPIVRHGSDKMAWSRIGEDVAEVLSKWPALMTHGDEDATVPVGQSVALGRVFSTRATTHVFPKAAHGMEWNSSAEVWDSVVSAWLKKLLSTLQIPST